MSDYRFAAILLAAGCSRRFEGENKLLEDFRGKPLLSHACAMMLALPVAQRVLVTGADAADTATLVLDPRIDIVFNPRFEDGMASSIAAGVAALRANVDAVLIMLGDMPRVRLEDAARLLSAFDPPAGKTIAVPIFAGRRGNPVLFGREHFQALKTLKGDRGARSVVERAGAVADVPAEHEGVLFDCDTRADFGSA